VEYLPLATDEMIFRPLGDGSSRLSHLATDAGFVGNSMLVKVRSVVHRCKINGSPLKNIEKVAEFFESSDHLIIREMMKAFFPEVHLELEKDQDRLLGYEKAVTWLATGLYRERLVRRLGMFNHVIIGDQGWREILGNSFRLAAELNYYNELPYFYNQTKVNFNATSRQMKGGVNQRVFDVPACRGLLLTDWTRQLEDLMEPGREIIAYRDGDEIPGLMERALHDHSFSSKIRDAGYKKVLSEHTYQKRVQEIIRVMKKRFQ